MCRNQLSPWASYDEFDVIYVIYIFLELAQDCKSGFQYINVGLYYPIPATDFHRHC